MAIKVTGNIVISDTQAISNVTSIDANANITTTGNFVGVLANGTSNVNIPAVNGNVNISVGGTANVLITTGTGVNVTGTLNATGNANLLNLGTAQVLATANVTAPQLISNVAIGTAPLVVTSTTKVTNLNADTLDGYDTATAATANTVVVRDANGNITGNFFIGNGSQLTGISAGFPIANGTSNINAPAVNGNINISVGGVANVLITTSTGVNVTGTLNATGNANLLNLGTAQVLATANVTAPQLISNVATGTAPLVVSSTTLVANLNANTLIGNAPSQTATANSIVQRNADGNITGNFFIGNGSQLTGISASVSFPLANGTSNINIPTASGNINFSVGGSANEVVFTSTGANIDGTLNTTGNANTLNLGTGTAIITTGNITTINSGLIQNGNSNVAITVNGNVDIAAVGATRITATSTGANVTGTFGVSGVATMAGNTQVLSLGVGTSTFGATGEIRATADIVAYYSDDRLKTKLGIITDALEKVTQLSGFYYEPNELAQSMGYTKKREVGLSAQEMLEVLPEVVVPAPIDDKYYTLKYEKVIPLIVQAIKELKNEIDMLKKR